MWSIPGSCINGINTNLNLKHVGIDNSCRLARPTPARPRRMERFCAPPTDASKPPTPSSRQVARKSFACSAAK